MATFSANRAFVSAFLLLSLLMAGSAFAAVPVSSISKNGGTFASTSGIGTVAWNNPSRASVSDNSRSQTNNLANGVSSNWLNITNFNFSIPSGATIKGIAVLVERQADAANEVRDNNITLLKNGQVVGANRANTSVNWPNGVDADATYGNSSDLWGTTWTAAEINGAGTGVAISAIHFTGGGNDKASVDYVNMTVYYTLDTTAPSISIQLPANGSYYGTTTSIPLNYTVSDDSPVNCSYKLDGGVTIQLPGCANTVFNAAAGYHDMTVTATDSAGNHASATSKFTVDTVAPTVASVDSDGATYNRATISPHPIKVTFSENIANTPSIEVNSVGGTPQTVNDCGDTDAKTFCFDYTVPDPDEETHIIVIYGAKDAAGNTMSWNASHTFIVDTIAPIITVANPGTAPAQTKTVTASTTEGTLKMSVNSGGACDGSLTFADYADTTFASEADNGKTVCYRATDSASNIAYAISDAIGGIDTIAPVTGDNTPSTPSWGNSDVLVSLACTDSGSGCASTYYCVHNVGEAKCSVFTEGTLATVACGEGSACKKIVIHYSVDNAGNTEGAYDSNQIWIDKAPPVFSGVPSDISLEATSSAGAVASYANPSATDAVSGSREVSCAPSSGSAFALGDTPVSCTATDALGNTGTATFTVRVQDTTLPEISAHDEIITEATGPSGATVSYTLPSATDIVDGTDAVTCSPASGSLFPIGSTTVTCNSQDAAGNSAAPAFFTVKVQDTTAPSISGTPESRTIEATSSAGAEAAYGPVSAYDTVDGSLPVDCSPASGSTFPLGSTTVTCTATDSSGMTATNTFPVIVQDTTPPSIDSVDPIVAEATSAAGADVTIIPPASNDLVDGIIDSSCDYSTGTFPLGVTTVTCSKTDAAGNAAAPSTFTVTVQDTSLPLVGVSGAPEGWSNEATASVSCSDAGSTGCSESSFRYLIYSSQPEGCSGNAEEYTPGASVPITNRSWVCSYASDNSGNSAFSASPAEFRVDQVLPELVANHPADGFNTTSTNITFNWTASDNIAMSGCALRIDGGEAQDVPSGESGYTYAASFETDPYNEHGWEVKCSDIAGNSANFTRHFRINPTLNEGNVSNANTTGFTDLQASINGTNASSGSAYNEVLPVNISGNSTAITFNYNFSIAGLNFTNMTLTTGNTSAGAAYATVAGIDPSALVGGKTIVLNNANPSFNAVCVKDQDGIVDISQLSSDCSGAGEFVVPCGSTVNGVSCTISGTVLTITGLKHSGAKQYSYTAPPSASSGGSSGSNNGGGSTYIPRAAPAPAPVEQPAAPAPEPVAPQPAPSPAPAPAQQPSPVNAAPAPATIPKIEPVIPAAEPPASPVAASLFGINLPNLLPALGVAVAAALAVVLYLLFARAKQGGMEGTGGAQ